MSAAPEEKPAEGGGKNPLMLLVVVLLVVVIALVSTFGYLFLTKSETTDEDGESAKPAKVASAAPPVFEKMDPFVLNLSGGGILQVECQAELSDEGHATLIKTYMPKIRSALILLLTSKSAEELSTPEGKARLRNQIRQVINETVSDSGIDNAVTGVVFTSLIIQS